MRPLHQILGLDQSRRFVYTPVPGLGIDVHAREWSAGRTGAHVPASDGRAPIVLVAGMGASSRYWVPLARRLAERHDVIAPDLPGFGRTPRLHGASRFTGPSPREQADHLLAWMDARGLRRVVLVGHSIGCQTCVDFTTRFPGRVERLILAGPTYEVGRRNVFVQSLRLAVGGLFELPALHLVLPIEYGSAGPARAVVQGRRALSDPIEEKLPLVPVPTLVVRGEFDPIATRRWCEAVAARLPVGGLVTIERAGHAVHFSAPDVTAQLTERFLDGRLDPARPPREGATVAPIMRRRRLGPLSAPPQPISSRAHQLLDFAAAGVALAAAFAPGVGPRTRQTLLAAAAVGTANTLLTDFGTGPARRPRRRLPMVTHLTFDFATGTKLLVFATSRLRREPATGRWITAGIGVVHLAAALLTHAPTGPARWGRR